MANTTQVYSNDTLVYTSNFPISAYPNALTVKLFNNNTLYGSADVTLVAKSVTLTGVTGINNGQNTYLRLYNGATSVDYANVFTVEDITTTTSTTTTTLPPTTTTSTTTTTLPPTTTTTTTSPPTTTTTTTIPPTTTTLPPTTTTTTTTLPPTTTTTTTTTTTLPPTTTTTTTKAPIRVTSVKISPTTFTLRVNVKKQLVPTILPSNATNKGVIWTTSNTKVATVTSGGLVTGLGKGKATITLTSVDGSKKATCVITVVIPVTGVKLNATKATIKVKAKKQLTATISPTTASNKAVKWTSSNTKIATVTSSGLVTAINPGKATITVVTTDGSKKATSVITVTK